MTTLFGKTYEEVGSTKAGMILNTSGSLKIRWGNKFIDLVKDGKIAVEGISINLVDSKDDIVGSDGIYVTSDGSIYIKVGDSIINLSGELSSTYVAYVELESSSSEKLLALENLGVVYSSLSEAENSNVTDGIVYIIESGTIYTVTNGVYTKLDFQLDTTLQLVLELATDESSSLYIKGYYDNINNCIIIGYEEAGLYLYSKEECSYVLAKLDKLILETYDNLLIVIEKDTTTINNDLIVDYIASTNATSTYGFRLYMSGGESTLEIDNLILRNGILPVELTHAELLDKINNMELSTNTYYIITDFLNEWELTTEDDLELEDIYDDDDEIEVEKNVRPLLVHALTDHSISPKVTMIDNPEWDVIYDVFYTDAVTIDGESVDAKGQITKLTDEYGNECNYDFKHLTFYTGSSWVYTFDNNGEDASLDGTMYDNIIKVDNVEKKSEDITVNNGNIVSLSGTVYDNTFMTIDSDFIYSGTIIHNTAVGWSGCTFDDYFNNTYFHGDFENIAFSVVDYPELQRVDKIKDVYMNDGELRVICIPDLIIPGMIMMFDGSRDIPYGWAICDGTNGTPNLIGKFIKADTTAGTEGGNENNEVTITSANLPANMDGISIEGVSGSGTISSAGEHTHDITYLRGKLGDNANNRNNIWQDDDPSAYELEEMEENGLRTVPTSSAGSHTHELDLNLDLSSLSISNEGGGEPLNIEPESYTLIFIMKL